MDRGGGSTRSGLLPPGEQAWSGKGLDWVRIWHHLGQEGFEGMCRVRTRIAQLTHGGIMVGDE